MSFFIIKNKDTTKFDMANYSGVSVSTWDKMPSAASVQSEISGHAVKFDETGVDFSTPIADADELDITATEITAPEKASVDRAIVAQVTKTQDANPEFGAPAQYRITYWIGRA